jgi:hypothetical protein
MPLPGNRVEVGQKVLVNTGFLALLALLIVTITTLYISSEHNFHWWIDWYYPAIQISDALRQKPSEAIALLVKSLAQERNRLYVLPLAPLFWIFGNSRLVYEIGLALVYLLPLTLVMGAIAAQLIQVKRRLVFWLTAFLTLLIPVNWVPTFMGIPDTGGAVFLGLATLVYLQDFRLKQWWRVPVIGVLIGLAILLRRPFIYGGFALLTAVALQALMIFCVEVRKSPQMAGWGLLGYGVRIGLIAATALATLMTIAPGFTYGALTIDYRTLYTSWSLPFSDSFSLYAAYYGWGTWLLVAIGFSAAIITRAVSLPAIAFLGISGLISLTIWTVVLRYGNVFYSLQTTPLVIIGLVALIWTSWVRLTGNVRTVMLSLTGCYLLVNLVIGLTPIGKISSIFHPLFALSVPPLVRTDYDQVLQLVDYLRKLAPHEEPIFVVGYQRLQLESSLVKVAELMQYGRDHRILNVLQVPKVISRDEYPLQPLLQAQYVVVPSRLPDYPGVPTTAPVVGEWLPNKEHKVVKVVFDAFTQNWEIAQDFQRLPVQFTLEGNTVVSIYQRTRPTSIATAVRTLNAIQQQVGQRPGSQLDWISLSPLWNNSALAQNTDNTHQLIVYASDRTQDLGTGFLYMGSLPEKAAVTGAIFSLDQPCVSLSLGLAMLNADGQIISSTEHQSFPKDSQRFSLSILGQDASYLLLNVRSYDQNNIVNSCSLEINSLAVSPLQE